MYGPSHYYGPADVDVPPCDCGMSGEDCRGECYEHSLHQQVDPMTGESVSRHAVSHF